MIAMNVEARGISVSFEKRPALRDATLAIPAGRIVGLLGPSGAGKTTLIRCIAGLLRPDAGRVEIAGRVVPDRTLARDIGYMAQEDALYTDLTGLQNLQRIVVAAEEAKQAMIDIVGKGAAGIILHVGNRARGRSRNRRAALRNSRGIKSAGDL